MLELVSSNTFNFLGIPSLLGRTILPEDGRPGAPPVFVMNYRFWQSEFAGDPKVLDKIFILNGTPTILVGSCLRVSTRLTPTFGCRFQTATLEPK